ncbi:hypothetical protein GCM10009087_17300 [Sphingomonas oligophenolica]
MPAGRGSGDLALAEAHGIAPLLGAAQASPPGPIDAGLQALFEENAERQSVSHSILLDIAACSATTGFEWLVLNGQPQAAFLYPDAGWRAASGIDLLVPTGQSHHIAHLLRSAGWSPAPSRKPSASLGRAGLRTDPRIILTGSTGSPIALHDRLFFSPGPIGTLLLADADRRPRRSMHRHDVPAPRPDATMALDILLRGNARRWARLAWLVDLSAIVRKLDDAGHARLIALIGQAGIEPLAAASFLTHRALLGALPGRIEDWLTDMAATPEITTRHALHRDAIVRPASVEGALLPAPSRMRLRLPRIARPLAHSLRGRLATWTRKAGQYQRDPATRNDRYPLAFRFARDQLGDEEALHILSFGCSTGEEVFTLRRYFPSARIKGIEVDPARVRICEARRRRAGDPGIRFECAATASGEPPESHDAIFCMAVFRDPVLDLPATRSTAGHLAFEEFDRGIEDLVRALKPGGLLFVEHSNFRVADTGCAPALEPVLHADPPRSGIYPGLYGRDGRRIDGAEETTLGYRKRFSLQTGQA